VITFIKVQAASIIGSLLDYLTTIVLVELFGCWYFLANLTGNIVGGILQFTLSRYWVFKGGNNNTLLQAAKFAIFFLGNIILSSVGIYMFTKYLRINYIISKTLTSVLLGISYNYIIQKKFVFS
jgi:putative flippase GtrA